MEEQFAVLERMQHNEDGLAWQIEVLLRGLRRGVVSWPMLAVDDIRPFIAEQPDED